MIERLLADEAFRHSEFPVASSGVFMAHAGVNALPSRVVDAVCAYTRASSEKHQEFGTVLRDINRLRREAALFIGADSREIALLGPTSLGLSLFANGIDWKPGDEVLCYRDDYPANVYPWMELQRRGVVLRHLEPEQPGEITPDLVESALTSATRLVALASCHFLTGYRIDVDAIGEMLRNRGILFSLDAIQTLGAFPLSVRHVDCLSADAHKWLLGPLAIGIVYVREELFPVIRPTLLGAWNVRSPEFVAQDTVEFEETARRYEPGVLNIAGAYGMQAAIHLLNEVGIESIAERILALKALIVHELSPLGFVFHGPTCGPNASGITTFYHPMEASADLFAALERAGITASNRSDRSGRSYIRLSPHFYNTESEVGLVVDTLRDALG